MIFIIKQPHSWVGVCCAGVRLVQNAHVLDGATEGVCDGAIVDGFLAEAKVCQFDVSYRKSGEMVHHFLHAITTHFTVWTLLSWAGWKNNTRILSHMYHEGPTSPQITLVLLIWEISFDLFITILTLGARQALLDKHWIYLFCWISR